MNSSSGKNPERSQSAHEINRAIHDKLERSKRVKISGLKGQDCIAVGLGDSSEVNISGDAGDMLGAFNDGAVIVLEGKCGDLSGDTLLKGGLIIVGSSGDLLGTCMNNGIIVLKGNCGDGIAKGMLGGTILVDGDVEGTLGEGMEDGTIIITGNVRGEIFKNGSGGRIFIGGEMPMITENVKRSQPNQKEISKLSKYFEHYGISAVPGSMTRLTLGGN